MVRPGIDYAATLWEKMSPTGMTEVLTGSDPIDSNSLAHGWAPAQTTQLSESVLGRKRSDEPGPLTGGGHAVAVGG